MNYFENFTWEKMLNLFPEHNYSTSEYHKILHPDFPDFLNKYLELPVLKRLSGIGLLCGTDWTKLYKNRFYYSRLDHSIGVALIIWHFTQDKAQTIAGLLHDVSTPVFSHVSDFRKGDALTQTVTEEKNTSIIRQDKKLLELLKADGLTIGQVEDYHKYPVADNEIPQLSADRLEYMFPSGMALEGSWTLDEVRRTYNDIVVLKNEKGDDELGFKTLEIAENYCYRFCMTGHVLQLNENKLTLQLLGQIMNQAVKLGILSEEDFMTLSEKDIIEKLDLCTAFERVNESNSTNSTGTDPLIKSQNTKGTDPSLKKLAQLYHTFRNMTKIEHKSEPANPEEYFNISLKVKQRYINPLVNCSDNKRAIDSTGTDPLIKSQNTKGTDPVFQQTGTDPCVKRLSQISQKSKALIDDFLNYKDTAFGCVKLI